MAKMRAYRLLEWGRDPEYADVDVPVPGPNEVLVKMRAAGLCRSDLDIMDKDVTNSLFAQNLQAGFTLGHENAGSVVAFGSNVTDLSEGENVVVYHMLTCGHCDYCMSGAEQSCMSYARGPIIEARGVGADGGLADYLLVPRHELVSIGAYDPVEVAPLTDAGATSYHAVSRALHLLKPGSVAVVIGLGGLGSYGVQFLKLLSGARVFALDVSDTRLRRAAELGADELIVSDARARDKIMDLTGGRGADVIIDFVGNNATLALAAQISRPQGKIILVGMEAGSMPVGWGHIASNCEFVISMGSRREDLAAICKLSMQGKLINDIERFTFDQVDLAYQRLRDGALTGRAVIVFD